MYYVNKIVGHCLSPDVIGTVVVIIGICLMFLGERFHRLARRLLVAGTLIVLVWGLGITERMMVCGFGLNAYALEDVEEIPNADVIVLLGGGCGMNTNVCKYADLGEAGDRVWHAARLWKSGKAPKIVLSGNDVAGYLQFLLDFGVPASAIIMETESRNTEENARFTARLLEDLDRPTALVVTSYSHMKRSMMLFEHYAQNVIARPVPSDYSSVNTFGPIDWNDFVPRAEQMANNNRVWHECVGILGYQMLFMLNLR